MDIEKKKNRGSILVVINNMSSFFLINNFSPSKKDVIKNKRLGLTKNNWTMSTLGWKKNSITIVIIIRRHDSG